jgi:4-hydroxy-tetrahydrodipicolinate synthase
VPLIKALFVISNPMPVKYAMNYAGFKVGSPRPPLYEPDEKTAALIRETLKNYKIDLPV